MHTPRKRFGQNFLVDHLIIREIIANVQAIPGQHIIEIGPGQGALTKGLIASGAQIDAIELDRDLAARLTEEYANKANFTLHSADILKFDLAALYANNPQQKLRLVGNLPYNISSPLLFKLFDNIGCIYDMHFMLQREVAERLTATPGTKQYGRMSVMAQYYCYMQIVLDVPPASFDPAPKVDSSVVYFKPHVKPDTVVQSSRILQQITTQAFGQRRKTITNSLHSLITAQELQNLEINPMLRAENLTLADYVRIANYAATKSNK